MFGIQPYYRDETVALYHGDCRVLLDGCDELADAIVTDPPYGQTSLPWDRWVDEWPTAVSGAARSMWTFGSLRVFVDHWHDFRFWRLSQDVVWEKSCATGYHVDRFRRRHEIACHFYRGKWTDVRHDPPRVAAERPKLGQTRDDDSTGGVYPKGRRTKVWVDDGYRQPTSVLRGRINRKFATAKPIEVLEPLIRYAVPEGGVVLDPFAGSGSTGIAARHCGRTAILIEADERTAELAAKRLANDTGATP